MDSPRIPLSVLDLVPVSEGMGPGEAIDAAMDAAQLADELGYRRYWFAEHHNSVHLASNATALLICRAASLTERIRVGAGGVMLPNHAPLAVVEVFGTLARMFGDRIDLGLGRAPGTDPVTASLLQRASADASTFLDQVTQLRDWTRSDADTALRVTAPVAEGTDIPMWVLGSTTTGARNAAVLGLPFAFASHFAPLQQEAALRAYREEFDAHARTAQVSAPTTMVSVNVCVAPTDEEAARIFTSHRDAFVRVVLGDHARLAPPGECVDAPAEVRDAVEETLAVQAVGSPQTVVARLEEIAEATGADELIITGHSFDPADRLRGLRLLAEAWGLSD